MADAVYVTVDEIQEKTGVTYSDVEATITSPSLTQVTKFIEEAHSDIFSYWKNKEIEDLYGGVKKVAKRLVTAAINNHHYYKGEAGYLMEDSLIKQDMVLLNQNYTPFFDATWDPTESTS